MQIDPIPRVVKIARSTLRPGWRRSDVLLVREHVRRVAQLEQKARIQLSGLFFEPEELAGNDSAAISKEREHLATITAPVGNRLCEWLLQNYVLWQMLVCKGNAAAILEPDLYEPLMRLFERGAAFTQHHGEAQFECGALPLQKWRSAILWEPIELGDDALSRLDT